MLLIDCPPSRSSERSYVWRVLFDDLLGLDCEVRFNDREDTRIVLAGAEAGAEIRIPDHLFAAVETSWLTQACLPREPLAWADFLDLDPASKAFLRRVPILYGNGSLPAWTCEGRTIRFGFDLAGGAFFLLTRLEELVRPERDEHGRFPAQSSFAYRNGFLGDPVVDQYAQILSVAIDRLWPGLPRKRRQYQLTLSHDVDMPRWSDERTPLGLVRSLGADVVLWRDFRLAVQHVISYAQSKAGNFERDPYNTFDWLLQQSNRLSLRTTFFFIAEHTAGALDGFYRIEDPWIGELMKKIHLAGHDIGIHGSYHSCRRPDQLASEVERLRKVMLGQGIEQPTMGGRQHYLRWFNPITWRSYERAGLAYDTSVGFAQHVGFRSGTCHEHQVFDLHEKRTLNVRERPLLVMDAMLLNYMKLGPEQALERLKALRDKVVHARGSFTLLWHNSMLVRGPHRKLYEAALHLLAGTSA